MNQESEIRHLEASELPLHWFPMLMHWPQRVPKWHKHILEKRPTTLLNYIENGYS